MTNEPDTTKRCLECSSSINSLAVKCPHCGGYQSWRRYLPFGESTLALILSTVALAAVLLPDPKALMKEISDYLSGTNFAMHAVLVDIGIDNISVLVANNQNSDAAINAVTCFINIPLDPRTQTIERLKRRSEGNTEGLEKSLTESETMGVFLISFKLQPPALVPKYESAVITMPTEHISPPLDSNRARVDSNRAREPNDVAVNFCVVVGTSFEDEFAVGGIIINPNQLNGMDVLDVLKRADYAEQNEHERETAISLVLDARSKAIESEP